MNLLKTFNSQVLDKTIKIPIINNRNAAQRSGFL